MSAQYIEYKGASIRYTDAGRGPAVILLHGFLESLEMWDDYAAALSGDFRVITIDLPGHGQSACFGYVHTMEEMAEVVKAVADKLRLKRYSLIGHSMGGYVALAFAERYPDIPKGIVLFYSTALADSEEKKMDRDRAIAVVKTHAEAFIKTALPNLFRPKSRKLYKAEIKTLIERATRQPVQGIIAALEGMKERADREVLLHLSPIPFCIVSGKNDPVIPIASMEELMKAPRVVDRLITDNGHMGYIEDRDECLETIRYFLSENQHT